MFPFLFLLRCCYLLHCVTLLLYLNCDGRWCLDLLRYLDVYGAIRADVHVIQTQWLFNFAILFLGRFGDAGSLTDGTSVRHCRTRCL